MAKVSVSMITYNHEQYIAQAIESVLSQKTDFTFELVVADDASTDNTLRIVQEYAEKYPNIIKLKSRKVNLGLVKNALQTISDCEGEYIALLEGDDYWVDDAKLQKQADFLDSNIDCSFCFTNSVKFWEGTDKSEFSITGNIPEKFDLNYFLINNVNVSNNTKMFRRSAQPESLQTWFYETVQWDWSLHVLHARTGLIGYLDFVSLRYRRHPNAFILTCDSSVLYESGLRTLKELNAETKGEYIHYFSQTWWHHQQLALTMLKDGEIIRFIKHLLMSLLNRPMRGLQGYRDLAWNIKHVLKG